MSQHLEALERANEIRLRRAALKREIKKEPWRFGEILEEEETPPWLRSERLGDLLFALPRFGPKRVPRTLDAIGVKGVRTMGNLTSRERLVLLLLLREKGVL